MEVEEDFNRKKQKVEEKEGLENPKFGKIHKRIYSGCSVSPKQCIYISLQPQELSVWSETDICICKESRLQRERHQ